MTQSQSPVAELPAPESQTERWLKYGGNVALVSFLVIILAFFAVYLAQRAPRRLDTTAAGLYSLKPQTVNIIKDNPQKIKIISLYTKSKLPKNVDEDAAATDQPKADPAGQAEKVADLLEEYRSKGKNIDVETIDPDANPAKVEGLTDEVVDKYGGQVKKYKAFAETVGEKYEKLGSLAKAERAQIRPLLETPNLPQNIGDFFASLDSTFRQLPATLEEDQAEAKKFLKEKPANYKGVTESVDRSASRFSRIWGQIIAQFKALNDPKSEAKAAKIPEPVRKYMTDSLPRYTAMKKAADDLSEEIKNLGELKLDELRSALRQRNSILVRGESEWKIIPYEKVWRVEPGRVRRPKDDAPIPPRFAGEQMITTAIWSLQHPQKLKVVFVRAGGEAVTQMGFPPFIPSGQFAGVAEQLRDYNYEVLDKDLTGMSAMQQQQQRMSPPEPSDAEIKDAIWVVVDSPGQRSQFGPAPTIAPKVAEHLMNGGSALFLVSPQADDMSAALKDWGISVNPNAVIVHEEIKTQGARGDDIDEALKSPLLFSLNNYGDHPLAKPLKSLPGVLIIGVPVKLDAKLPDGVKASPLLPIPDAPEANKSWAETDFAALREQKIEFNPDKGDISGPLYAGAAAEKGNGRVVVIGSLEMPTSGVIAYVDRDGRKHGLQFPANSELFMNSIYWLSRQETMIAISPAAMDVSRIGDMSRGAQNFWRVGLLLIGLPAAVVLSGALVWLSRRD